jgi:SAM-dependent methyltransferase
MDRTLDIIPFHRDDPFTVLDLGCGTGIYDFEIARRWPQAKVLGMDINSEQIGFAQSMARELGFSTRLEYLCVDILSFVPHTQFDIVLLSDVVEHFQDPHPCLAVAQAALRQGDIVLVSVPTTAKPREDWWFYRQFVTGDHFATATSPSQLDFAHPILRYWHKDYTPQEMHQLLAQHGFDVSEQILCRFDLRRLPRKLRRLFSFACDDHRTLRSTLDSLACALLGARWAKTCILRAIKR